MRQVALLILLLISVTINAQNAEKKIAILKVIDRDENVAQGLKLMLRSRLTIAVTATPGYIGLDRVDIDAVLSEQNFQRSGLVKESQIKQLGVALGADLVMVAEAAWLNFYKTELVISAKLIDVESFQGRKDSHDHHSSKLIFRKRKLSSVSKAAVKTIECHPTDTRKWNHSEILI